MFRALVFLLSLCMALVALAAGPARAAEPPPIAGPAIAQDADTITVTAQNGPVLVRLFGIAAPEMNEAGGWHARAAMDAILAAYIGSRSAPMPIRQKNRVLGSPVAPDRDMDQIADSLDLRQRSGKATS